jgi:ubiquinone/menaquinone biosynthesis C-methylase UbiE
MENEVSAPTRASDVEASYFELQAYTAVTKHGGGLETTKELVSLCQIKGDSYVLDVGCGAGATPSYLAKEIGCKVVAVDLRENMVAVSTERARKEGLGDRIEFRVADAQELPFEDGLFDAVLCESVATFVEDKQKVVSELARVIRPGGHVGLNEEIWIETPPTRLMEDVKHIFSVEPDIPTAGEWLKMLEGAGLKDVVVRPQRFTSRGEASQIKRYRLRDMVRWFYRILALHLKNPAFRAYMKERRRPPKDGFKYFGYGLFVGRKGDLQNGRV